MINKAFRSSVRSGQSADGGARTRDRRVLVDFRADSLATVPPMPHDQGNKILPRDSNTKETNNESILKKDHNFASQWRCYLCPRFSKKKEKRKKRMFNMKLLRNQLRPITLISMDELKLLEKAHCFRHAPPYLTPHPQPENHAHFQYNRLLSSRQPVLFACMTVKVKWAPRIVQASENKE
ncbi:hypothetical protein PoB_005307300 [Plakobranchus ocellatus]|uniref:Uncharacterized protein n=1 Tax=Plakobranchus ocellatus TaxID=259542 RepID=A0AAV4C578_9GAST|nr:hypothetical protein PoB_005307300 [Plakobranchus ocellatus]